MIRSLPQIILIHYWFEAIRINVHIYSSDLELDERDDMCDKFKRSPVSDKDGVDIMVGPYGVMSKCLAMKSSPEHRFHE